MQGFRQEQKQTQQQIFAPQLRQSLKILQVSALDLRSALLEELQTNPVLEELPFESVSLDEDTRGDDSEEVSDSGDEVAEMEFTEDFEVLNELDEQWQDYYNEDQAASAVSKDYIDARQHFLDSATAEKSLQEHLLEQASMGDVDPGLMPALRFLIGSLDDKGFLSMPIGELAANGDFDEGTLREAQGVILGMEPTGIGAEDIRECLLAQLRLMPERNDLAEAILEHHYDLLVRHRIRELAKKLSVGVDDVQEVLEETIANLDPAPGRKFAEDVNQVVRPDVTVERAEEGWSVVLNNEYIPRLRISRAYKDLIASGNMSGKEREYLKDRIRAGKFIINAIEQRQNTLERISRQIVALQEGFLEHGMAKLAPLTMSRVGELLELHETTVSRAIANKFMETPHGVMAMKAFFTTGLETEGGEGSVSNASIKQEIGKMIGEEDAAKPLSDQKIANMFQEKGVKIARRTVAKYREELGIPPTNLRRKY